MGECLITEVAVLREENGRMRQCLERIHDFMYYAVEIGEDRDRLLKMIRDEVGKDFPCIQKT